MADGSRSTRVCRCGKMLDGDRRSCSLSCAKRIPLAERLDGRWTVEPTGCWLWTGDKTQYGYGNVWVDGKRRLAHRAIWALHNGPIPDGMVIRHSCDTPSCVNPEHLLLGTQADNVRDMHERGRARGQFQSGPRQHGTLSGSRQHYDLGEKPCDACWQVRLAYQREYRRRRKAGGA